VDNRLRFLALRTHGPAALISADRQRFEGGAPNLRADVTINVTKL
jgi:hypothetical protein